MIDATMPRAIFRIEPEAASSRSSVVDKSGNLWY
tara:strand:- start:2016 stop:2117 length:102 start_codon:yes stop_codon:yes gene_type:complete